MLRLLLWLMEMLSVVIVMEFWWTLINSLDVILDDLKGYDDEVI